jgi:hypothetical protein
VSAAWLCPEAGNAKLANAKAIQAGLHPVKLRKALILVINENGLPRERTACPALRPLTRNWRFRPSCDGVVLIKKPPTLIFTVDAIVNGIIWMTQQRRAVDRHLGADLDCNLFA